MKNLKFLYTLLLFVSVFGFVACGDDDEKDAITPSNNAPTIEGIWMLGDETEEFGFCLVLNSDKTGVIIEGAFDEEKETRYFRYTYDSEKMVLTITESGEWPYEIDVYRLTSSQLITIEGDGELCTFSRYNGNIKDLERLLNMKL